MVELVPDRGAGEHQVVEPRLDRVRVDDENTPAAGHDLGVDPGLALLGADLLRVEEDGGLAEVTRDQALQARGQTRAPGVAHEEQHATSLRQVVP